VSLNSRLESNKEEEATANARATLQCGVGLSAGDLSVSNPWYLDLIDSGLVGSTDGRGTTRAEDAQGIPTQMPMSPSILVYEDDLEFPELQCRNASFRCGNGSKTFVSLNSRLESNEEDTKKKHGSRGGVCDATAAGTLFCLFIFAF